MRKPRITVLSPGEAATALEAAETTLARWAGEVARLTHAAEVLAGELAEAQARAADDLLDAEDADDDAAAVARVADDLLRRQTEQGVAVQAAERAAERLAGVRRDVLRARAASIRTRAVRLQEIVAMRAAKTDQLLAELAEWERVAFAPAARVDSMGVASSMSAPASLTQQVRQRAEWLGLHAGHLDQVAAEGPDHEVTRITGAGLPELAAAELAVVDVELTTADVAAR